MRAVLAIAAILIVACATGYQSTYRSSGLEVQELAGARRLFLGEKAHVGMPHVTVDPKHAVQAAARLKREIPDLELVSTPEEADFVISVLFTAEAACSHCESGPETEWLAIVERGGATHRNEYSAVGPFLQLSGEVRDGSSVTRGFVRQLKELLRPARSRPSV